VVEASRLRSWWIRTLLLNQWGYRTIPEGEYVPFLEMQRNNNRRFASYRETWDSYQAYFESEFIQFMEENVFNQL